MCQLVQHSRKRLWCFQQSKWSALYLPCRALKHFWTCELWIGYMCPQGSQQLSALFLSSLLWISLCSSTLQRQIFYCGRCCASSECSGGHISRTGSLQWSALGHCSVCPNDLMQKLIVASTLFHRKSSNQGQLVWVLHSKRCLKFSLSLHPPPPPLCLLTALYYGLWHPPWSITSLLCPQLYSSSQTRQEQWAAYLLSEHTTLFTATECSQDY